MDTKDVNRFEIIDNRACKTCRGERYILTETDSAAGQSTAFRKECPTCFGMGSVGRQVIVAGPAYKQPANAIVTVSLQDDGRTLKVFVDDRDV